LDSGHKTPMFWPHAVPPDRRVRRSGAAEPLVCHHGPRGRRVGVALLNRRRISCPTWGNRAASMVAQIDRRRKRDLSSFHFPARSTSAPCHPLERVNRAICPV
jgi:hypothetical protein